MKASAFEQRHAMALRLCIYAVAFSVYFFDRDDVVWRFIRYSASRRALEHCAFLIATLLIGLGAYLCTRADACAADHGAYLPKRGGLWALRHWNGDAGAAWGLRDSGCGGIDPHSAAWVRGAAGRGGRGVRRASS
jgi:hypothetical protein